MTFTNVTVFKTYLIYERFLELYLQCKKTARGLKTIDEPLYIIRLNLNTVHTKIYSPCVVTYLLTNILPKYKYYTR